VETQQEHHAEADADEEQGRPKVRLLQDEERGEQRETRRSSMVLGWWSVSRWSSKYRARKSTRLSFVNSDGWKGDSSDANPALGPQAGLAQDQDHEEHEDRSPRR